MTNHEVRNLRKLGDQLKKVFDIACLQDPGLLPELEERRKAEPGIDWLDVAVERSERELRKLEVEP